LVLCCCCSSDISGKGLSVGSSMDLPKSFYLKKGYCARGWDSECLWLGDNDVTLSMAKRAYQNFNKGGINL
jgi:hypothetical protein